MKSGDNRRARQIDDTSRAPFEPKDVRIPADLENAVAGNRNRLSDRAARIDCVDSGVVKDEIRNCWRLRAHHRRATQPERRSKPEMHLSV